MAVGEDVRRAYALLLQINHSAVFFDKSRVLERWLDYQLAVLNEDVRVIDGGFFELTVAAVYVSVCSFG